MRWLALGDSYTIGEGVAEAERWPVQLAHRLRDRGLAIQAPEIIARTAWTTDELMDAIDEAKPRGPFDIVSLMIGVNDQYRARPVDQFAGDFSPLLDRSIALAGGKAARVIAISIPDWGATPFAEGRDRAAIAREIDDYNARAAGLAAKRGIRWHDVTTISRGMLGNPELVIEDQLHPSGAMYTQWAASLEPAVAEMLSAAARSAVRA